MDNEISQHDKQILNRLFNPNLPYEDVNEVCEILEEGFKKCALIYIFNNFTLTFNRN